ncbi:antitoxin Xre/MbcA/ParS toxin-binding domain-containing protein [Luteibacter sp. RCC_6_2]|jgi:putative toxin-antitoxin system antitoxin component (TIGR02293 family)|uniref:antitoxin Xre/MbcA/ParS toxin-binding domain-containing protein n=1 Tax=Luteibacter sp. RCC_6_2 TaxID=3239223 RepID=UPI0035261982
MTARRSDKPVKPLAQPSGPSAARAPAMEGTVSPVRVWTLKRTSHSRTSFPGYAHLLVGSMDERVSAVRAGLPSDQVKDLANALRIGEDNFMGYLGLKRSTTRRKITQRRSLATDESEKLLDVGLLIAQVEQMVGESGDPEGFDAAAWVGQWLQRPLPALGNRRPIELLDVSEGRATISNLLRQAQTGTFA